MEKKITTKGKKVICIVKCRNCYTNVQIECEFFLSNHKGDISLKVKIWISNLLVDEIYINQVMLRSIIH